MDVSHISLLTPNHAQHHCTLIIFSVEDKDSLVFKTAVEYQLLPHTGTASTTDRGSPDAVAQEETDSVENRRAPVKTQEESRQLTDSLTGSREGSYPIPPDESVEMGLTISMLSMIRQHQLNQIESTGPEDSVSSVSSACVLENTAFLQDVCDSTIISVAFQWIYLAQFHVNLFSYIPQ